MKMTKEQFEAVGPRILESLEHRCSACGGDELGVNEKLVAMAEYERDGGVALTSAAPLVACICLSCSHVHFFSAVTLGVL